jgi:hypothetical protein
MEAQGWWDAIKRKLPQLKCPLCGRNNFSIDERAITPLVMDPGAQKVSLDLSGRAELKILPMAVVTCDHCAHVLPFSIAPLME